MKVRKIINITTIVMFICLIIGVGAFIYNAESSYKINKDFISLPLQFSPDESSSAYQMEKAQITVYGGFIKGIQKSNGKSESIVIRALSPLPAITIKGNQAANISLLIENINPDFYAKSIKDSKLKMAKVAVNTVRLDINLSTSDIIKIQPSQPKDIGESGKYPYIILGDNRDGYGTFGQIIQQVNGINPVFVIDNGDLVFSGKPNQYRLFDKMVSKLSTTLCTVPGNHDIRGNGRDTYTMLYGPAYYSFDFGDSHFVFLDSSPGWAEKRAISDEQYTWVARDLKKSEGKQIFVITHIPPQDPRSRTKPNEIPNLVNEVENGENWVEQRLSDYNENKDMNHGFQDPQETAKFENIMSSYHVDTVYLSHIHSYLEYSKNSVRYLITGGAGAELLTKNSYYHYMIAKFGNSSRITTVELPSPTNNYLSRYSATAELFASAMYEENPVAVVFVIIGFVLFILLLIIKLYIWKKKLIDTLGRWMRDVGKYAVKRFKELFI